MTNLEKMKENLINQINELDASEFEKLIEICGVIIALPDAR